MKEKMQYFHLIVLIFSHLIGLNFGAKLIATTGNTVQLTCSNYAGIDAYWMKNDLKIIKIGLFSRLKFENTTLIIERVTASDTGLYSCVNKKNVTFIDWQLIVTNAPTASTEMTTKWRKPPMTFDIKNELWFDDKSLPRNSIYTTTIGNQVRMDCRGGASLSPYIEWMKDSKPIRETSYRYSSINFKWRQQPWLLVLQNVLVADSGIYECQIGSRAINRKKKRKFHLIVDDIRPTAKPVITLFNPKNITAMVGTTVTLTCQATAKPMPYIKWERITYHHHHSNQSQNLTFDNMQHDDHKHNIIMLNSTFTEIIEANYTKVIQTLSVRRTFRDDIVLNELQFDGSGEYSCVAFNEFGFVSETGNLKVIPEEPPSSQELELLYYEKYGNDRASSQIPLSVVIVLPICVLILIIIVLLYWKVQQNKDEPTRRKLPTVPTHCAGQNGGTNINHNHYPVNTKSNGSCATHNCNGSANIPSIVVHPLMRGDNTWNDSDPNVPTGQKYKSLPHVSNSPKPMNRKISKSHDHLRIGPDILENVTHGNSVNDLEWDEEDLDLQLTIDHPHIEDEDGIIILI